MRLEDKSSLAPVCVCAVDCTMCCGELRNHQIYIITDHVSISNGGEREGAINWAIKRTATTVGNVKIVERYIKSNNNIGKKQEKREKREMQKKWKKNDPAIC